MTVWCLIHHAPFQEGKRRWCTRSQPSDSCEVDPASLPPRPLPAKALFLLGTVADEPGIVEFLRHAKAEGFGVDQPGDADLSDEKWSEVAELRVSVLISAFRSYRKETSSG